jgi:hypothetical protein
MKKDFNLQYCGLLFISHIFSDLSINKCRIHSLLVSLLDSLSDPSSLRGAEICGLQCLCAFSPCYVSALRLSTHCGQPHKNTIIALPSSGCLQTFVWCTSLYEYRYNRCNGYGTVYILCYRWCPPLIKHADLKDLNRGLDPARKMACSKGPQIIKSRS